MQGEEKTIRRQCMTKLELLLIVHTTRADLTQVKVGTATAYRTPKSNSVKLAEGGIVLM